jgi:hypothetical protein
MTFFQIAVLALLALNGWITYGSIPTGRLSK